MNVKKNFVLAGLSILALGTAFVTLSYPIHPPVLSESNDQVVYSEQNYPIHPPVLEQSYPIHPPVL
jgi:hypothetical protein